MRRIIESARDVDTLARLLKNRKFPMTVSVADGKPRSIEQNSLQRLWIGEIAEQMGDRTPEEVRGYCKLHVGVPIMREDDDFREAYDRVIRPLEYEAKLAMMMVPLDLPVTRIMTTKQKKRYLDGIWDLFSEQGVKLTDPDR